jgi:hypothetical protein
MVGFTVPSGSSSSTSTPATPATPSAANQPGCISKSFFNKINKTNEFKVEDTDITLKSAFRNLQVYRPEGQIHNIKLQLHNQLTNKKEIIIVKDVLIIDSIYDMILSRKTIRSNIYSINAKMKFSSNLIIQVQQKYMLMQHINNTMSY